jgi:hypothetical protein
MQGHVEENEFDPPLRILSSPYTRKTKLIVKAKYENHVANASAVS